MRRRSPHAADARDVMWAHLGDRSGIEHARLRARSARGIAVLTGGGGTWTIAYRMRWDAAWRIRAARIEVRRGARTRMLALAHDGDGRWTGADGRELRRLRGCVDLDLWPTPLTNTPAIRRLELAPGRRSEIRVAYVEAPALSLRTARQAYERLDATRYRFTSPGDRFSVELRVDAEGVVEDYPGLVRRLRCGAPAPCVRCRPCR